MARETTTVFVILYNILLSVADLDGGRGEPGQGVKWPAVNICLSKSAFGRDPVILMKMDNFVWKKSPPGISLTHGSFLTLFRLRIELVCIYF